MTPNDWNSFQDLLKGVLQRNQVPVKVVEKVSLQTKVEVLVREKYPQIAESLVEAVVTEETLVISISRPEAAQYLALRTAVLLKHIHSLPGGEAVKKIRIKGR